MEGVLDQGLKKVRVWRKKKGEKKGQMVNFGGKRRREGEIWEKFKGKWGEVDCERARLGGGKDRSCSSDLIPSSSLSQHPV